MCEINPVFHTGPGFGRLELEKGDILALELGGVINGR